MRRISVSLSTPARKLHPFCLGPSAAPHSAARFQPLASALLSIPQVVAFGLSGHSCCIASTQVCASLPLSPLQPLHSFGPALAGLVSWAHQKVPVIDLAQFLNQRSTPRSPASRILFLRAGNCKLPSLFAGLIVDHLDTVYRIQPDCIHPLLSPSSGTPLPYTLARVCLPGSSALLLDLNHILSDVVSAACSPSKFCPRC